jgi:hypothetical protein
LELKIVRSAKKAMKYTSMRNFMSMKILNEDFVLMYLKQKIAKLDKPIAVAFSILDLSKDLMYQDFYFNIKPVFKSVEICTSDTDSLLLYAETDHYSKDLNNCLGYLLDTSNYPESHPNYSREHKNELGFWKDEGKGRITITECVCLRSKCYCFQSQPNKYHPDVLVRESFDTSICKGVKRSVTAEHLKLKHYKTALFDNIKWYAHFFTFRKKDFVITTSEVVRSGLANVEIKRHFFGCGVHSVPYGSVMITKYEGECPKCIAVVGSII